MRKDSDVARLLGVDRRKLAVWKGRNTIPVNELTTYCNEKGKNLAQLLTGEALDVPHSAVHPAGGGEGAYVAIPVYAVEASAGPGAVVGEEQIIEVVSVGPAWFRREFSVAPEQVRIIFVTGDSMEPTLRKGEALFVHVEGFELTDAIYAVRKAGTLQVKRLTVHADGQITIASDNPAHRTETIDPKDEGVRFEVVGRVVGVVRKM